MYGLNFLKGHFRFEKHWDVCVNFIWHFGLILKMNVGLEKINKASNLHKSFTESLDDVQPVCGRHLVPLFTLYTDTETN